MDVILQKKHAKMAELYKLDDFDACVDLAIQLLQSDPVSKSPIQYIARIHTRRRKPELARPYWEKLIDVAPELPEPFLQSARIARLEKNWSVCERYIEEFISLRPDHSEALGIQIQCIIHNDRVEKIGRAFANLCRVNLRAVPPLALQAVERGMGVEVAKAISRTADKDQSVKELCENMARSARNAAVGFEIHKEFLSAANCYQAMQIYTPNSSYPTTALRRLRKPFLKKAQGAYREKNYTDAIKHAEKCIEILPAEAEPYIIAGRSCAQLDLHLVAFDFLGQEIDRLWNDSWLVLNYARAAMSLKKNDIAYAAYSEIKSRDDEKSGKFHAECAGRLEELSERAAREVQALLDKDDILLACEKIFDFQKIGLPLNSPADLAANIRELGQIKLKELCDFEEIEALDYAKNLVRLDASAKYACRIAGSLLMVNQMYAEAYYYWSQLAKLDDKNPEPMLNLARCYAALNNKIAALKTVSALLELYPHHEEGQEILVSLADVTNLSGEGLN